jgi:hypothetical protein
LEREGEKWVKYLRIQQQRQSALEIMKNPACNVSRLDAQQQQANSTIIRYMSACDALQAAPQLSLLPGFRQQQLETGQTAEDGYAVSRPGLRDKGLEVRRDDASMNVWMIRVSVIFCRRCAL